MIEASFGIFSGKSKKDVLDNYLYLYQEWHIVDKDITLPEASESKFEAGYRFLDALIKICEKEESYIIGISGHGKILATAKYLLGGEAIAPKNGEFIKIKYKDGK